MTGIVAYTGIRVNVGMFLQQCTYAPRCAVVAWVSRTKESVGTCLELAQSASCLYINCLYTAVHKGLRAEQHLPLYLLELLDIKALVPAYVNEHLYTPVELEQ
jgi:hypothetical protein